MANIQASEEHPSPGTFIYTWGPMANADVGLPVMIPPSHSDKTISVDGTPGAALVVDPQGSDETVNPGTQFHSLREPGNALLNTVLVTAQVTAKTAMRQILEGVNQIKLVLTGGDGTTAITVRLKCTTQARR